MSKQHEVEKRADGRLSAVAIIEKHIADSYNEAVAEPAILGPRGELAAMAKGARLRSHVEACVKPEANSEEEALLGIIAGLALLADCHVMRVGYSIHRHNGIHCDLWCDALAVTRQMIEDDGDEEMPTGRLIRERLIAVLDEIEQNERSSPDVQAG